MQARFWLNTKPQLLHCHGSKSGGGWCQCQNIPGPDLGLLSEGGGNVSFFILALRIQCLISDNIARKGDS